jgi:hypothetical protein
MRGFGILVLSIGPVRLVYLWGFVPPGDPQHPQPLLGDPQPSGSIGFIQGVFSHPLRFADVVFEFAFLAHKMASPSSISAGTITGVHLKFPPSHLVRPIILQTPLTFPGARIIFLVTCSSRGLHEAEGISEARRLNAPWWSAGRRRPDINRGGTPRKRSGGPIARLAKGVSQAPWRLPALHPPFSGERKKGPAPPAPQTTGQAERWLHRKKESPKQAATIR